MSDVTEGSQAPLGAMELLQQWGIASTGETADKEERPDWRAPESVERLEEWQRCRDAFEGTSALIANARTYIPKHPLEHLSDYRARVAHSAVFNTYAAVIDGLVGLAYAKAPTFGKDVHPTIIEHAENIDGAGTTLHNFAQELTEDGLTVGTSGFMVYYPPRPPDATAQDELNGTLRPYWRRIHIEDVISWDDATIGARTYLTQLVIRESLKRKKGRFGRETVEVYREFLHDVEHHGIAAPVTWILWEKRTDEKKKVTFVPIQGGFIQTSKGVSLSRIPYVGVLMGRRRNRMIARPRLHDLLDLMMKGFRIDSDRCWLMHKACVPIPVRKGYKAPTDADGKPIRGNRRGAAASNVIMDLPADTPERSGASFSWAEISGTGFQPTKDELEKLKAEQGALGLSFLAPSTRQAETADARRLDARIENASLSTLMSVVESAIEEGLILHAEYLGLTVTTAGEQSGGSWTCNRDYERTILSEGMIKIYSELVLSDQLTLETFLEILLQGRALPDGFNIEQEATRLKRIAADRAEEAARRYAEMATRLATTRETDPSTGSSESPLDAAA